jgi:hypothetical protein
MVEVSKSVRNLLFSLCVPYITKFVWYVIHKNYRWLGTVVYVAPATQEAEAGGCLAESMGPVQGSYQDAISS